MKKLKDFVIISLSVLVILPFILITAFIFYEYLGMCVNHIATYKQTNALQANLEKEVSDIEITSVYSRTGGPSGSGKYVLCESSITFSSEAPENEITDCMSEYYVFDGYDCYIAKTEDDCYTIHIVTYAPFLHNIEGY